MNAHLPTGSSDEIITPHPRPTPSPCTGHGRTGHAAAEEVLRHALHARCGDAIPRWADVLVVARSIERRGEFSPTDTARTPGTDSPRRSMDRATNDRRDTRRGTDPAQGANPRGLR
jgi:hypothetical protein